MCVQCACVRENMNHTASLSFHQIRTTLETLTAQDWVREKCTQHASRLLDPEYLGDKTLTPAQVSRQERQHTLYVHVYTVL